jgi:hypothetical protein
MNTKALANPVGAAVNSLAGRCSARGGETARRKTEERSLAALGMTARRIGDGGGHLTN